MPQVIVTADRPGGDPGSVVMLREWVSVDDFGSAHFVAQLIERLAWAVSDAQDGAPPGGGDAAHP